MKKLGSIVIFIVLLGVVVYIAPWVFGFASANMSSFNLNNGVFYYSSNNGEDFEKISSGLILSEINDLEFGPDGIVYAATNQGIFQLDLSDKQWDKVVDSEQILSLGVQVKKIAFIDNTKILIAVYEGNKGRIYQADKNFENLEEVYSVSKENTSITDLAYDKKLGRIYFSSDDGILGLSENNGESFRLLKRFDNAIGKIFISPLDNYQIFLLASSKIYKSEDAGNSFVDLNINFSGLGVVNNIDIGKNGIIYVATNMGDWKSETGGWSWIRMDSLLPKDIASGAIVYNSGRILSGFDGRVYLSDNGVDWRVKTLNQSNVINFIKVNPNNSQEVIVSLIRK